MCGLFGAIGRDMNGEMLTSIAREAGRRGPNAWGIAWLADQHIASHRQIGKLTEQAEHMSIPSTSAIIGQSRLSTSGQYQDNSNNQPLIIKQVAISHNGIVYNVNQLTHEFGLQCETQNDSEVIAHLITRNAGNLLEQTILAIERLSPSPIALLALDQTGIVTIRWRQPLYVLEQGKTLYFCSRKSNAGAMLLPDDLATYWSLTGKRESIALRRRA